MLHLVEKSVIGCTKNAFSKFYLTKIVKNSLSSNNHKTTWKILVFKVLAGQMLDVSQSPSKKQIRTSKTSVFIVLAGQLENSRHWQGKPTSRCIKKAPFTIIHEMNEHKNHVGCLSKSIKKADQDLENIRFHSFGSPTEKQSTLVGLPTSR